ncbi:hypothetical protein [Paracoccus alcaliphilus]|nr:hypothetical protein [Paracoccus alcaliphilus]WCR20537.1 hypothetical protein JHW40_21810 [Paracoccus alcaliphilus]
MMYPDINHDFRHHRVTGPERGFCGLAHVVFRFTTSPVRMPRLTRLGIAELAADIRAEGWTIRSAGPRWFTVWSQDTERLRRERVVLVPADWIGLTETEMLAILLTHAQRLGLLATRQIDTLAALDSARAKLWRAIQRA